MVSDPSPSNRPAGTVSMPLPSRVSLVIPLSPAKSPAASEVRPSTMSLPVTAAKCVSVTCEQLLTLLSVAATLPKMTLRTWSVRSQIPPENVCEESTLPPMFRSAAMFQTGTTPPELVTIAAPFNRRGSEASSMPSSSFRSAGTVKPKTSFRVPDPREYKALYSLSSVPVAPLIDSATAGVPPTVTASE